jgi:hypothetical protein
MTTKFKTPADVFAAIEASEAHPGLAKLESEKGGTPTLQDVLDCKFLPTSEKRLIFKIAGTDYPKDPLQSLKDTGFLKLQQALAIAYDADGFDAVVGLLNKFNTEASETERDLGCWAATEFDGLTYLDDKYEGSTSNLRKYQYLYDGFNANQFPEHGAKVESMTTKRLETRQVMQDVLREQLAKLAIKYAKKPELQLIRDLQSQLAPDIVDDEVLGHVFVVVGRDFEYCH